MWLQLASGCGGMALTWAPPCLPSFLPLHPTRPSSRLPFHPPVLDLDGNEVDFKTVSVNAPLRFGGVTAYQTDWAMSALQLRVVGSAAAPDDVPVQLPMASLAGGWVEGGGGLACRLARWRAGRFAGC